MASSSDESDTDSFDFCDRELMPYEFEPRPKISKGDCNSSKGTNSKNQSQSRKGNTKWCKCGNCKEMESEEESICCREDVPETYLQGKSCIIEEGSVKNCSLHVKQYGRR